MTWLPRAEKGQSAERSPSSKMKQSSGSYVNIEAFRQEAMMNLRDNDQLVGVT